jgi:hypothetical protein
MTTTAAIDSTTTAMEVVFVAVGRFKGIHLDPPARLVIQVGFGPP